MNKPKYQNYRVCYPNTDRQVYELYKYCQCTDCVNRLKWKRQPNNKATATTKDISKIGQVAEFLKNWTCEDGTKHLEIMYFNF